MKKKPSSHLPEIWAQPSNLFLSCFLLPLLHLKCQHLKYIFLMFFWLFLVHLKFHLCKPQFSHPQDGYNTASLTEFLRRAHETMCVTCPVALLAQSQCSRSGGRSWQLYRRWGADPLMPLPSGPAKNRSPRRHVRFWQTQSLYWVSWCPDLCALGDCCEGGIENEERITAEAVEAKGGRPR